MTSKTLLALETSSTICGVSIVHGDDILSLAEEPVHRKHAEILPKFIESALQQGQKSFEELDAIAVSIGPGSFTGLRIGLGFAKGMAYAHGLPIIPVPTLLSLAFGLQDDKPTRGIAHSHSRKVFYQEFEWQNTVPRVKDAADVGEIDLFIKQLKRGFQWNCDSLLEDQSTLKKAKPSAAFVGRLASIYFDEWAREKPYDLVPDYIAPFEIKNRV